MPRQPIEPPAGSDPSALGPDGAGSRMSAHTRTVAEAFSGHRFTEAYPHLAPDVRWVNIGGPTLSGRDDVVAACEESAAQMATTTNTFQRFVVVADEASAAVDVVATYAGDDGTFVVASCDIYEFDGDLVTRITSYTALLPED